MSNICNYVLHAEMHLKANKRKTLSIQHPCQKKTQRAEEY